MGNAGGASDESPIDTAIGREAETTAASQSAADGDSPAPEFVAISDEADAAHQERRIDALVQRVAAAKAARVVEAPEDPIEATIRRVAEAKRARDAATAGGTEAEVDGPPPLDVSTAPAPSSTVEAAEQALEVVAEDQSLDEVDAHPPSAPLDAPTPATDEGPPPSSGLLAVADEDPIEATIRRVAAAKAAQRAAAAISVDESSQADQGPPAGTAPDEAADQPPPSPKPKMGRIITPPAWREPLRAKPADPVVNHDLERAVAELRRDLDETRLALASLTARIDMSEPSPTRIPETPEGHPASDEEDWDELPSVPRISLGQPPRPGIFRDPPPRLTASGESLPVPEEVMTDTPPVPKPLPPAHAEPRRGLDLLPRTYRVTVEDNRGGVDLVPLHRALLAMAAVRDMSLLSYSNGVAIVSLDTLDALNADDLCDAIGRAMSRPARVEVHNEQTMVVKLVEAS
ncbi:MAG: hypothetical protein M3P30_01500 [Chloroflexota bacterium]|nr:hypothetical protein [Chloroflexota bacterium]